MLFLSLNYLNYTLLGFPSSSGSIARLSRLRDRGPLGGGCFGGSLCCVVCVAFSSGRQGFHVSPDIAARR